MPDISGVDYVSGEPVAAPAFLSGEAKGGPRHF